MILSASAILLALGACDERPCSALGLDERAHALLVACGEGPREAPAGLACVAEASVLWALETRWAWDAPSRGTGCGPLQVVQARWYSSASGEAWTPPCAGLEVPDVGLAWGVRLLRRLGRRWGSWRSRARAYNGSAGAERYAERAVRLMRRVRR